MCQLTKLLIASPFAHWSPHCPRCPPCCPSHCPCCFSLCLTSLTDHHSIYELTGMNLSAILSHMVCVVDSSAIDTDHFLGLLDTSCHAGMIVIRETGLRTTTTDLIRWARPVCTVYILLSLCLLRVLIFLSNRLMFYNFTCRGTIGGGHGAPRWLRWWVFDDFEPCQVVSH